jgi:prepilin-type N-terminal cleavage/methylation domain-containing protein
MKIANPTSWRRTTHRGGFTLIELLVVMAIIATLAALALSATMRIITVQEEANTKTLVQKVASTLDKQWQAVIDKANKEPIPERLVAPDGTANWTGSSPKRFYTDYLLPMAGGDAQRARVIWIKMRLKQEFPISFQEALNPAPLPALPTYYKAIKGLGSNSSWAESSACLLLALSQAREGIVFNLDVLGPNAIGSSGVNGWDANGVKIILDGWSQPVVFFRWPTGNPDVDGLNPAKAGTQSATFRDPQDPNGLLQRNKAPDNWWSSSHRTDFEGVCHSVHDSANKPYEYYMVPVVASGGPDKKFGLTQPTMVQDGKDSNDNIYSYNLR